MPLSFDALYYAEKVLMETGVARYLRVKCSAKQGSFTDSDDRPIVERCQHLHSFPDR